MNKYNSSISDNYIQQVDTYIDRRINKQVSKYDNSNSQNEEPLPNPNLRRYSRQGANDTNRSFVNHVTPAIREDVPGEEGTLPLLPFFVQT